jgi:oxygen-dependent protoporphyrinogen oxidase
MFTNEPARVAIVGGGIAGLAAAFYLERNAGLLTRPLSIDLFEASPRLGGKIHTVQKNGMTLELGAESFLSRKPAAVDLCRDIGIDEQLRGTRPDTKKTFVWHRGKLHPLPTGLSGFVPGNLTSLFSTSLLSLGGKLRVVGDYFLPAKKSTEDESLESFLTRRLGKQAYQRLAQPLLCGIYAGDGQQLSLCATYPELRKLELEHGSLIRGLNWRQRNQQDSKANPWPPFVTLAGGMGDLIAGIGRRLNHTTIHLDSPIIDLRKKSSCWELVAKHHDANFPMDRFEAVVLTCPAFTTSKVVESTFPKFGEILDRIPHVSTMTVNLWFDAAKLSHRLDGYGFVIPSREQNGVTAVTWTSSKHFDRTTDDSQLIRAYLGRSGAEADCDMSDEETISIVRRELKRTMAIEALPAGYLVQRWPKSSPQYTLDHPETLKQIDKHLSGMPGIFLGGASYRGVGIPDCIRNSQAIVEDTIQFISRKQ